MMTIVYRVRKGLYVNLTNRCPCACTFCLRQQSPGVYGSNSLWLDREPTVDEVKSAFLENLTDDILEVVFCGYGEPTERLDDLITLARWVKKEFPNLKVRVNTNGLSDLINARATADLFTGAFDCVSISLNTDDPEEYARICKPKFGDASYNAMLNFTRDVARVVPEVVMSVVGEPITSLEKQERCKKLCESLGARLRVRPYENA